MTDVASVELSADEAQDLTEEIRVRLDFLLPLIKKAFEGRADRALGYDSWQAYCAAELSNVRVPLGDRPAMVAELRQAGMSQHAIAASLGVGVGTVNRDLSTVPPGTVPDRVVGLDGREQPASRPAAQAPEPVNATRPGPDLPLPEPQPEIPHLPAESAAVNVSALASWTAEEREEYERENERLQMIRHAHKASTNLISDLRHLVNSIVTGVLLGEPELVTPDMVAEVRRLADTLESRMEVTA